MKKLFKKPFVHKFVLPILRASVKQIPIIGTPIAEATTNILTPSEEPKKHNWISIATQGVIALCIIYAFYTKAITLEELIKFLQNL